jgi:hypothetical protein
VTMILLSKAVSVLMRAASTSAGAPTAS